MKSQPIEDLINICVDHVKNGGPDGQARSMLIKLARENGYELTIAQAWFALKNPRYAILFYKKTKTFTDRIQNYPIWKTQHPSLTR